MKVFFVAQGNIGDCISSLVTAKYFKEQGYYTIGFVWEANLPFCGVEWLDEVWTSPNCKYFDSYDVNRDLIVTCSWMNYEEYKHWGCQIIYPRNRLNNMPPVDSLIAEQNLRRLGHLSLPHHELFAWRVGLLQVDEPTIVVPTVKTGPKFDIVIHQGSLLPFRCAGADFLIQLYKSLRHDYRVVVIPRNPESKKELDSAGVSTLVVDLATFINVVSECKVLVTPDSGILHLGYALKKPMVALETYKNIEWVIKPYPLLRINTPRMRQTKCSNLELCMKYKNAGACQQDYVFLRDFKHASLILKNDQECYIGCPDRSECLHDGLVESVLVDIRDLLKIISASG